MSQATEWYASEDSGSTPEDPRVVAAVREYLAALEIGQPPSRQEFLARHAAIARELASCLDSLEFVHRAALDLRDNDNLAEETGDKRQRPLGDFRIVREIGRGGMGVVYEAVQLSLGRRVALKVLPFVAALDSLRLQRFKNEAQAAAQLHHTNIVPVYAVGAERGVHYYAMQLIEGQSLSALIKDLRRAAGKSDVKDASAITWHSAGSPQPPPDPAIAHAETLSATASTLGSEHSNPPKYFRTVAVLVRQAALALEHAHRFGVIHRDIKPANLILDERQNLWITDFGLALFHADAELTRSGDMLGTLRYMSPEQAAGDRVVLDHRTDIYSLGATMYEFLTLEPAVTGSERHLLLRQIIEDDPRPPSSLEASIPTELETIVMKAIAKSPADRYATAQQFADDLECWLEDKPILARRPTIIDRARRWGRRHRGLVASAVGFVFLAMLGLFASTILISREHAKTKAAYEREIEQRAAAEASFRQAREAVETFTQLAEEELANKPSLYQTRRRFLQAALDYYENFLQGRHDDLAVEAELAATSKRVAQIVAELSVLAGFGPLMLASDRHVRDDLQMTSAQREKTSQLIDDLWRERAEEKERLSPEAEQKQLAALLARYQEQISAVLDEAQIERLRQIAWQQQGPFAFKSPEVAQALQLTAEQRRQIAEIIEMNGLHRRGGPGGEHGPPPGGPGEHDPGEHGPGGPRPPRPFDQLSDHPPGDPGPPPPRKGKGGPPPRPDDDRDDRGHRPPGPPEHDPHHDFRGPPPHDGPPHDGPPDRMRQRMNETVEKILAVLSPQQRAAWQKLIGKPFSHDLHYGPDDWFPR